jgi:hypothetical protein
MPIAYRVGWSARSAYPYRARLPLVEPHSTLQKIYTCPTGELAYPYRLGVRPVEFCLFEDYSMCDPTHAGCTNGAFAVMNLLLTSQTSNY